MVSFFRYALCSLFLFSFDVKSVTIFNLERRLQRPSQNRTCGFPTSGSSVNLTSRAIGCTGCEQCIDACLVGAIHMDVDRKAIVCKHCGICISFCPHDVLEMRKIDGMDDVNAKISCDEVK